MLNTLRGTNAAGAAIDQANAHSQRARHRLLTDAVDGGRSSTRVTLPVLGDGRLRDLANTSAFGEHLVELVARGDVEL